MHSPAITPAFHLPPPLPITTAQRCLNSRFICPRASSTPEQSAPFSFAQPNAQAASFSSATPVTYTSLSNNSFALKQGGTTLLVDPWLYDDLIFLDASFFRLKKTHASDPALDHRAFNLQSVDAIVLTQGLADHAHPPTLKLLPKNIPVIAPPSAEELLRTLGFEDVSVMRCGQTATPIAKAPNFKVSALKGSMVGPPWDEPQAAYILQFQASASERPVLVYHEPHGNHDEEGLRQYKGRIDTVIAPVVESKLALFGNLVNGIKEAIDVCKLVRPKTCVAFNNSGGEPSGFLSYFVSTKGNGMDFEKQVRQTEELKDMKVVVPEKVGVEFIIGGDVAC